MCDKAAPQRFFKRAMGTNSVPDRVVIDKSGANLAGLQCVNVILKFTNSASTIKILQVKYLNNIMEKDHRFIKRITLPYAWLQGLALGRRNISWDRDCTHDPKAATRRHRAHRIPAVCGARSLIASAQRPPSIVKKICDRTLAFHDRGQAHVEMCSCWAQQRPELCLERVGHWDQPIHQSAPLVGQRQGHEAAVAGVDEFGDQPFCFEP